MSVEIRVPTLGESVTEATVAKWFKQVGDAVTADEPIVELETDKVTLEFNAPASGTLGPSWDWWDEPAVKKDLKLTDEQVRKIREIFEKREAEVKPVWDQLNREGDRLDKMTRERVADEATYAVQVSKVHHLFADVRKSRTMMLYRMYRELQPEQYKKLQEIMERRRSTDGRSSGPSGPR